MQRSVYSLIVLFFFLAISLSYSSMEAQQPQPIWTEVPEASCPDFIQSRSDQPAESYTIYSVRTDELRSNIQDTRDLSDSDEIELDLPWRDQMHTFQLEYRPVLTPALEKKYPEITTYRGFSRDGSIEARVSITPLGVQATFFSELGSSMIHPVANNSDVYHYSYTLEDAVIPPEAQICGNEDHSNSLDINWNNVSSRGGGSRGESVQLRTYRLIIGSPAEYTQSVGGTVSAAMASIVNVINSMNGYLNRSASIEFMLIEETENLIFVNEDEDPYPNTNQAGAFLNSNSSITSQYADFDKYDVSHVFSVNCSGAAGISGSRIVCAQAGEKGRGVSCTYGSLFGFIMTTTHEFGHHLSASHTFNNCPGSNGQRSGQTAYEPGSGTTIMSYAGSCGSGNNVGPEQDYFHGASIEQMRNYVTIGQGSSCGTLEDFGNTIPNVDIPREDGFYIPVSTPFELTAQASDMEGDTITYCWEQFDNGPITELGNPTGNAPAFRSFRPTQNSTRIFPELPDILNDNNDPTEVLVDYSRDFNFRCTVRDNNHKNGGQNWDGIHFMTTSNAGPFEVMPMDSTIVHPGDYVQVQWNVANTDKQPVHCKKVDITMSTNGRDFDILLRENAPNTGSAMVTIPNVPTDEAWVKVKAAENIFFNVSDGDVLIDSASEPNYLLSLQRTDYTLCLPATVSVPLATESLRGFNQDIQFEILDTLEPGVNASIAPSTITPGDTAMLNIQFDNRPANSTYELDFRSLAENGDTLMRTIHFDLTSTDFSDLTLSTPYDQTSVPQAPQFNWDSSAVAERYNLQISLNPDFEELIFEQTGIEDTVFNFPDLLSSGTLFYWRIVPVNSCGTGQASDIAAFQTKLVDCQVYTPNDLPKNISTAQGAEVNSIIEVPGGGAIEDVNIPRVRGPHQYIGDIRTRLISPSGTVVRLWSRECFNGTDFDLGFDDDSPNSITCPLTSAGIVTPQDPLSDFQGEDPSGEWTLRIQDVVAGSGGRLNEWRLELCSSASANPPYLVRNDTFALPRGATRNIRAEFHLLVEDDDTDPEDIQYTLVDGPDHGTLLRYDVPVQTGETFTQREIYDWFVSYKHDSSDVAYDQFRFIAEDDNRGWTGIHTFNIKVDNNVVVQTSDPSDYSHLRVYPNPVDDHLTVELPEQVNQGLLEVIDLSGRTVFKNQISSFDQSEYSIEVQLWSPGMYLIRLQSGTEHYRTKVIVQPN